MLTKSDIPRLLESGLRTEFQTGFNEAPPTEMWKEVAMVVPSTKGEEVYNWLGANPKMREWRDERAPKSLLTHGFTLVNKDFEATISVHRNAIEDDQYGQILIRARALGNEARRFYDEFMTTVLEAGVTELAYDGQYFFDTDHSSGASGTQSNKFIGASYDIASAADAAAAIIAVVSAMQQYNDDAGKKYAVIPNVIMVPTNLQFFFKEALDPMIRATNETPAQAMVRGLGLKVMVNPYLSTSAGANARYYFFDLNQPLKPLIFQKRKDPEFVALDKTDDYDNFMRKEVYYGVDWRGNFGYGMWMYAAVAGGA